ncbi:hypothetical protein HPC49_30510 [Pyxidicoccus fallax]|uniref:Integral membrane protein n=1 Tax=Pyxidicoccus fallax TaxID=394095 RepID=A0A848LBD9_9BACT|nr:hypothetical protein [Pyxidicoccus fallax]NMO15552.1 hypothetical protein [Pyxidicoccus fallax]NPC82542.1 hypothetical protein [Pyxidicoccus fallax]
MTDHILPAPSSPLPPMRRAVLAGLLGWACVALLVSASGVLESSPPAVIPLLIGGSVLTFALACASSRAFRAAVLSLDPRPAVLFHLVRVVAGVGFLVLHARGRLPGAFALQAGWGDIAVGLAAPLAALAFPANTRLKWTLALAWSVAGLLDILWVVGNAQRMILLEGDVLIPATLTRFPFSLLPLFIVPLVFITHGLVLARLFGTRPAGHPTGR